MAERLSVKIGESDLTFETGRIAKQAAGSVLVTYGETMVLSATVVASEVREGQNFFPLTVDYREKAASAGKIPGNFFRREGRPSEREVLVCRLTDRPLRPLFPKGFMNEVQVFSTVYSADNIHNPDVMSINGASAAFHISQVPFNGPIGAVRVGLFDGELVVNPPMADMADSDLDLVLAGTAEAITMVEGMAREVPEDLMVEALEFGHGYIKQICAAIEELREKVGVPKMDFVVPEIDEAIVSTIEGKVTDRVRQAANMAEKQARADALRAARTETQEELLSQYGEDEAAPYEEHFAAIYDKTVKRVMREQVVRERRRLDGRGPEDIRNITIEVDVLPRVHGSCLFTRGETQALVTTTLGTSRDEQRMDELTGEEYKRFMLHYNFPAWSVGEVKRIMGPGRREIGHGKLAERALEAVLPFENEELDPEVNPPEKTDLEFPYTVRVVSDITESNGSSSMASVCGGTLSMMAAGVPIRRPVAGIAMGLIKEGDDAVVLSDILGDEDHLGDMDFKICGTREGITAFQMDTKITGVSKELMLEALEQAKRGRLHILDKMAEAMPEPRPDVSKYAPRIYTIKINVDQIREVIGPGGRVVRDIQRQSGADIDIQEDGTIVVAAVDKAGADEAIAMIQAITATPEVGSIYKGVVSRIMNFGAFVSIMGNKEGLVHISELAPGRVGEVTDVVDVGDEIQVKLMEIDRMGRLNLSKVQAEVELGLIDPSEIADNGNRGPRDRADRGDRGDRGGRGGGGGRRGGRDRGGDRGGDRGARSGGRGRG